MKLGVLSDAHGNLPAFEACIAELGDVDALLFGGDVLGYYFDGPTILRRLRQLGAICLAGNHDLYFLSQQGREISYPISALSHDAYRQKYGPSLDYAASDLTPEEVEWLASLPCARTLSVLGKRVAFVHGSPWRPADEYIYPDYAYFERFEEVVADLIIMGHTHRPFVREGARTLMNPGSCGQPRDGDLRASCATIEITSDAIRCKIHRVTYDAADVLKRCDEVAPSNCLLINLLTRRTKQ